MGANRFHQPLRESLASIFLQNINVAEVRECRLIRDYARQADLTRSIEETEADRALNRFGNDVPGNALRPISAGQIRMHRIDIQPSGIGRDGKIIAYSL